MNKTAKFVHETKEEKKLSIKSTINSKTHFSLCIEQSVLLSNLNNSTIMKKRQHTDKTLDESSKGHLTGCLFTNRLPKICLRHKDIVFDGIITNLTC